MASIEKRTNNSYRITVSNGYDIKGKKLKYSKTVKRPDDITDKKWDKELIRIATEFENKVSKGLCIDSSITLDVFVNKWFEEYANNSLQPKTLYSYRNELDSKIIPALGHIKLNKITPVKILEFLNNLLEDGVRKDGKKGGYSDRVIKYQWQILSSILHSAVYWQILENNPCERVKVPKNSKTNKDEYKNNSIKFLDENQAFILLDILETQPLKYKSAVYIALMCGLRKGEVLGLTWNDIDFENNLLSVNKSRTYIEGIGMFTVEPKTKSSIRTISMPSALKEILISYKAQQDEERKQLGDIWDNEWYNFPWILTQFNGKGMHYCVLSQWLSDTIKKYNNEIKADNTIPKPTKDKLYLPVLSFHALRHTSATLLIGQNTDIRTVSSRLGHNQTSTTMNIYVHGLKSVDRQAANTFDDMFNKKKNELKLADRT